MGNENKSKLNEEILKILNDGLVNGFENNHLDLSNVYVILIAILSSFLLLPLGRSNRKSIKFDVA